MSINLYAVIGGNIPAAENETAYLYIKTFRAFKSPPDIVESMVELTEQKLENPTVWKDAAVAATPKKVYTIQFRENGMNIDDCFWYDFRPAVAPRKKLCIPKYVVYGIYDNGHQDPRSFCVFDKYKTAHRYMKHIMTYDLFHRACIYTLDASARVVRRVGHYAAALDSAASGGGCENKIETLFEKMEL
jgi:hypothetical protein